MLHRAYVESSAPAVRTIDGLTREACCARYQRKVLLLARRIHERLSAEASVTLDDLAAFGAIGLLEAFDRFDPKRGIQFSTYAEYRIRGAIFDALRTQDTFTRRRRQLARKVENTAEVVRQELGRPPEPAEVAGRLEIGLDAYWGALARTSPVTHVSIDDTDPDGRPLFEIVEDATFDRPGEEMLRDELRGHLRAAIEALPERQRHIVLMYYAKDMSLAEISAVYGVTVSRVSQILTDARIKMRAQLEAHVEPDDLGQLEPR
jgi:RNA polymerase sigma factor for flagellar operon FliA